MIPRSLGARRCVALCSVVMTLLSFPPSPALAHSDTLLSSDQLEEILGTKLAVQQWEIHSPNGPGRTSPTFCRIMSNSTTTLVFGALWESYEGSSFADGEGHDYQTVVGQIVGIFPTPAGASRAFGILIHGLRSCGSTTSVEHRTRKNLVWHNSLDSLLPQSASWHSILDSQPRWRCALHAQLHNQAVVETSVCRFVSPHSRNEAQILSADVMRMSAALTHHAQESS